MKKNLIRHLGVALSALALATMLWGCSNMAPTGVPNDQSLQTQSQGQPSNSDSDINKWW